MNTSLDVLQPVRDKLSSVRLVVSPNVTYLDSILGFSHSKSCAPINLAILAKMLVMQAQSCMLGLLSNLIFHHFILYNVYSSKTECLVHPNTRIPLASGPWLICVYKCCNHFVKSIWTLTESLIWMSRLMTATKDNKAFWGEQNSPPNLVQKKRAQRSKKRRQAWGFYDG